MIGLDLLPSWHRSCRADVPIAPDAIAGILDGDGSLTLVGRRGRQVPSIALSMRDDDPTPLAVARSLAAVVAGPAGHGHANERKIRGRVPVVAFVTVVVRFVERHPPRPRREAGAGFGGPKGGTGW